MTDEKKSYRVTDRRHGALEAPEAPLEAEALSSEGLPPDSTPVGEMPPVSFTSFIMSLGAQAGLLLGGVEGAQPDLKGAQWLISILEMLRDKTEGRRSEDETQALDAILYELRMAFVER